MAIHGRIPPEIMGSDIIRSTHLKQIYLRLQPPRTTTGTPKVATVASPEHGSLAIIVRLGDIFSGTHVEQSFAYRQVTTLASLVHRNNVFSRKVYFRDIFSSAVVKEVFADW